MTRDEAIALSNCTSYLELAELLNITPAAVSQWDKNKIPMLREFQIREIHKANLEKNNAARYIQNEG